MLVKSVIAIQIYQKATFVSKILVNKESKIASIKYLI